MNAYIAANRAKRTCGPNIKFERAFYITRKSGCGDDVLLGAPASAASARSGEDGRVAVLQAGDQVVSKDLCDLVRGGSPGRIVPARNPVDRAEDHERRQRGIPLSEDAGSHAVAEDLPESLVDAVALGNDLLPEGRRECFDLQGPCRAMQDVDEQMHERDDEAMNLPVGWQAALLDVLEFFEDQSKRIVVTDVENLLLVPEVVIEISRGHL